MTTVACVLRSGGIYDMSWVARLRRAIRRHHQDVRFVCLTDLDERPYDVDVIPLAYDLPGWWSKLELFRPGVFPAGDRIVYLDLDVLVIRDLEKIFSLGCNFGALRGFMRPDVLNSSVMTWSAGTALTTDIWKIFEPRQRTIMKRLIKEGDQEWITGIAQHHARRLQDALPKGYVQSFKVHHLDRVTVTAPPPELHILVMHGKPKASDLPAGHWAREEWERAA